MPIFDVSIQLNLYQYCITVLMYHDMAIDRYIVPSLVLSTHVKVSSARTQTTKHTCELKALIFLNYKILSVN